ncbi:MAG: beta-ketoacyl-ACP synthase III [Bacteroidota bacterium]
MPANITAVGRYLPPEVFNNKHFEAKLDTTDEWIRTRTGIVERRFASTGATSDLVVPAVKQCLEMRNISAEEIDCIIVCTISPDYFFPSTAAMVQKKIGAKNAWGFDLSAACSGFLYGLVTGAKLVEGGAAKKVLVCGADKMSSVLDFDDRSSSILFGDGAGVVLLEKSDDPEIGVLDQILHMDGNGGDYLYMTGGGSFMPATPESVAARKHYLVQDGKSVFKSAVVGMSEVSAEIMEKNNLTGDDIAWLVPHQANLRIISATAERMGLSMDKVMINIDKYGNTTAGTLPICLSELHEQGKLKYGDRVILSSFGAGFTWGSIYLRWGIPS